MPSSTTPGNPIIDSSRATMSAWPSPRVDRLGTPKAPAIRFTRAMIFGATRFTHLLRPARLLAPQCGSDNLRGQRGVLLPGFQRARPVAGYDCSSDWTPLLAGLSPARMTASLAAPTPRIGPALVFERLWEETGCRAVIAELAGKRKHSFALERAVFLTVLHRLFVSGSDRAADRWREDYAIVGACAVDCGCYSGCSICNERTSLHKDVSAIPSCRRSKRLPGLADRVPARRGMSFGGIPPKLLLANCGNSHPFP